MRGLGPRPQDLMLELVVPPALYAVVAAAAVTGAAVVAAGLAGTA